MTLGYEVRSTAGSRPSEATTYPGTYSLQQGSLLFSTPLLALCPLHAQPSEDWTFGRLEGDFRLFFQEGSIPSTVLFRGNGFDTDRCQR